MKTERIEFVATPGLKAKMQEEACNLNISLDELIMRRLESSDEEKELEIATAYLMQSTAEAQRDWSYAVEEVTKLLEDLRLRKLSNKSIISTSNREPTP